LSYRVVYHTEVRAERSQLPANERVAMNNAVEKLELFGPDLPAPHQSNVEGARNLRELRPRAGRSPWRALYRRVTADTFVIAAIAPDAEVSRRRFNQAARLPLARLDGIELPNEERNA
jgi:hypothetical protein